MHIIFISLEIQRVRVTAYHSLAAGWLCEPVVEGEDSLCLVPYLRCLVRRYDRGRLDVVQSTGGKEQHSAAVQLGKGVRDTIQVFQGPLPVLKYIILYIYIISYVYMYTVYVYLPVGGLEYDFYDFPNIGNVIIPTDFHIFQRG